MLCANSLPVIRGVRYYEKGGGIEGEFAESWDNIEKFYLKMNF
jgi:hypothetical protein